ncbi:ATP dependent helicase [Rhizophagus clarus]|uniref:ATP dependent helicase n=1 Tax=Rhizophagus clarus TaxID=94130 RepID=A0A8H3LEC4_9GLOM|nr:ATP dependent helicase [Rhizophagus clarus]
METDYDKKLMKSQTQDDIVVRLTIGDELKLRFHGELRQSWEDVGHVIKIPNIPNNVSDEVGLESRRCDNTR